MMRLRLLLTSLGLALVTALSSGTAQAADYSNTRLMDDQVFDNVGSMGGVAIQNFLSGDGRIPGGSTCLKSFMTPNFYFDGTAWHYGDITTTDPNNPNYFRRWSSSYGPNTISAASAIYQAAQQWGINPQVIMATLQKEESLISGSDCNNVRMTSAMGYGCPDGGARYDYPNIGVTQTCVTQERWAGFTRQVLWGSWQLKFSKERAYGNTAWDGDDAINYSGYMTEGSRKRCGSCTTFQFDGNAVIDGQTIHLENGTTAALYTYTPHLGQAFPGIFEGWFGSVRVVTYSWSVAGQTTDTPLSNILPGQTATFTVSALNTGSVTWLNSGANPVRLGANMPNDRTSAFATGSWISPSRPANMNEASVAPGATATFTFTVRTPNTSGHYKEYFSLLSEGVSWMNNPGMYFDINVVPPTYTWSLVSQAAYTDSSKGTPLSLSSLSPGQSGWLVLRAKNTGNMTWSNSGANPVRVGTEAPRDHISRFSTPAWLGLSRAANMVEASVAPGATATFEFPIKATPGPVASSERFNLLTEGITWMNDLGLSYFVNVNQVYSWSLASQYAFTNSTKTTPVSLSNLTPGQTVFIGFTAKNTGNTTWYNSGDYPVDAATARPTDRFSPFATADWLGAARPVRLKEASVAPGATGTFEFTYKAPTTKGTYSEYFRPVAEGITHMNDVGMNFFTVVR